MIRISSKSVWTFLIAGPIFVMLPIVVFVTFRFFMARLITRDNAGIVFDQFQTSLDKGALIRDSSMAAEAADHGYREKMHQTPLDGWGRPFRIDGSIQYNQCVLNIESAGPDGAFGTGDDVSLTRSFDLVRATNSTTRGGDIHQ